MPDSTRPLWTEYDIKSNRRPAECHPDRPSISRGLCRSCLSRERRSDPVRRELERRRARELDWERAHLSPERLTQLREEERLRRLMDPSERAERRAQKAAEKYRDGGKAVRRARHLGRYSLSVDDYDYLVALYDGCCHLCIRMDDRPLNIDHDHDCCPTTSEDTSRSCGLCIRGLLCLRCNTLMSFVDDDCYAGWFCQELVEYQTRRPLLGRQL